MLASMFDRERWHEQAEDVDSEGRNSSSSLNACTASANLSRSLTKVIPSSFFSMSASVPYRSLSCSWRAAAVAGAPSSLIFLGGGSRPFSSASTTTTAQAEAPSKSQRSG